MSHHQGPRRTQAEELSTAEIEDSEPTTVLTTGDLSNSSSPSVDPQQSLRMLPSEHPDDPHATAYGSQTAPSWEQLPSRGGGSHTPLRVASITATQGCYSPRGITHRSELHSDSGQISPTGGDTTEDFIIRGSEVIVLCQEYSEFITLKNNAEIVLAKAMEATERLNTVFNRVRASMSRMSPRMKELFSVPSNQASGKTLEPSNNRAHDKAAVQAATQCIIAQTAMMDPAPSSGAEERVRTMHSRVPGDRYSWAPLSQNIPEDIPHSAHGEQGEDSQLRHGREVHTVYACDTPEALDANAQYWSELSTKATRCSRRALELQLKLVEEKVNNLLHKEAPEEVLLEAAWEARNIHFQLDQSSQLREAGLMHEQQVQNYGPNPIIELHIPQTEWSDITSEYSGIQQMVRQALQNASLEDEPEKFFLAKASGKMGNPPTYGASTIQLQLLGQCLTFEAQKWFYQQVEQFDREVKHWDLESVLMGLQKWFMPTLLLNKVAIGYDHLMQDSMNVQQLNQQLTKLAKQMVELPDAYSYQRQFMNALKPSIRKEVIGKGFTAEFSKIDELVEQAVIVDNVKCYTLGYNSNQSSAYPNKPATADHKCVQQSTTLNRSSNANAGSSSQHRPGNNNFQSWLTPQLMSAGGGGIPTQSNPVRTAPKANNPVVCFNCNQPGHIQPNCPFPDKDRRIAGARIDEGQIEEFDEYVPHPEKQQEFEDQPEEDDQHYHFDDDEEVSEAEADLRVSAVLQTGGKEQPVYDHQARKKACPLHTRSKENETISVCWDIGGTKAHCLLDSGCEGIMISSDFVRANKLPKFELEKLVILQLACVGSKSTVQYGLTTKILLGNEKYDEYFDIANVDYYNVILGTPFLCQFEILLDFKHNHVLMGKLSFPNWFGSLMPTEADENENRLQKEKPKALPTPTSK
ncbi:hypothetical protein M422DRAFT_239192 [Sphaerobolus stellatus SS14]|nr:hypothetical protein M422DRAFT_239192 [Sphaerobolus stellatus SS14]